MAYPTFTAGNVLTAKDLRDQQWKFVGQGLAMTVNNSATLTDTNLVVPLIANAEYIYRLILGYSTEDTGDSSDFKFDWNVTGGGSVIRFSWGYGSAGSGGSNDYTSVNFRRPLATTPVVIGASGSGATNSYHEYGLMVGGSTDGTATFRFAQNSATAVDSSITGSSKVFYLRIG